MNLPQHRVTNSEVMRQSAHLRGLPSIDVQHAAPQILFGLKDIYLPLESQIGGPGKPIVCSEVKTKLDSIRADRTGNRTSLVQPSVQSEASRSAKQSHYTQE